MAPLMIGGGGGGGDEKVSQKDEEELLQDGEVRAHVRTTLVAAVRAAGMRCIVQGLGAPSSPASASATSVRDEETTDADVFYLLDDYVPHSWLFPRCDVILHHGGAGTTAAAMRSGRPQVLCGVWYDQRWWAERAAWAGVALACPLKLPLSRCTAEPITAAIIKARHPQRAGLAKNYAARIRIESESVTGHSGSSSSSVTDVVNTIQQQMTIEQ